MIRNFLEKMKTYNMKTKPSSKPETVHHKTIYILPTRLGYKDRYDLGNGEQSRVQSVTLWTFQECFKVVSFDGGTDRR